MTNNTFVQAKLEILKELQQQLELQLLLIILRLIASPTILLETGKIPWILATVIQEIAKEVFIISSSYEDPQTSFLGEYQQIQTLIILARLTFLEINFLTVIN